MVVCHLKVHVEEWRIGLWYNALKSQGIDDAELARQLQEKFRTARLEHFVLEQGVQVNLCQTLSPGFLPAFSLSNSAPRPMLQPCGGPTGRIHLRALSACILLQHYNATEPRMMFMDMIRRWWRH